MQKSRMVFLQNLSFNRYKHLLDVKYILLERLVGRHKVIYSRACMKHCSMVLSSNLCSDCGERAIYKASRHIHRDLSCLNYLTLSRL